ncbi:MAG TPA: type VI secretion system ATPase TssH, partial [Armatimonadetes bacterium]|nr:type VI secretion system ATPase TssH [Armatimonadota bacterium]
GSHYIQELGAQDYEQMRTAVMETLRAQFRPEFLNRIDEIVIFHALSKEHLKQIVDIQLERLRGLLRERNLTVELTAAAKERLAEEGYDPVYGARPLKRTLQRRVQDPLARALLEGQFREGDHIVVDVDRRGELVFRRRLAEAA